MPQERHIRRLASQPSTAKLRQVEDTTGNLVQGLVNFVGAAAPAITKTLNENIISNKISATMEADSSKPLTEPDNIVRQKAYTLRMFQLEAARGSSEIQSLPNLGSMTDEEFDSVVQDKIGSYLDSVKNLPTYEDDIDLQKAAMLTAQEVLPAVSTARDAAQLKYQQGQVTDLAYYSLYSNTQVSGVDTPEGYTQWAEDAALFGLSQTETEAIMAKVANDTDSISLLEFANSYEGNTGVPLGVRQPAIREKLESAKADLLARDVVASSDMKKSAIEDYVVGRINRKQLGTILSELNRATGNKAISEGEFESELASAEKSRFNKSVLDSDANAILSNDTAVSLTSTDKDFSKVMSVVEQRAYDSELKSQIKDNVPEDNAKVIAGQIAVTTTVNAAAKYNKRVDKYSRQLTSLARMDSSSVVVTPDGNQAFTPEMQKAIDLFDLISNESPESIGLYLKGEDLRRVRSISYMNQAGVDKGEIVSRSLMPAAASKDDISEASKDVAESFDTSLFGFYNNLSEESTLYLQGKASEILSSYPIPNSDLAKEEVSKILRNEYAATEMGRITNATPALIKRVTGGNYKADDVIDSVIDYQAESILDFYEFEGDRLNKEELSIEIDEGRGFARLQMMSDGYSRPIGGFIPISQLEEITLDYSRDIRAGLTPVIDSLYKERLLKEGSTGPITSSSLYDFGNNVRVIEALKKAEGLEGSPSLTEGFSDSSDIETDQVDVLSVAETVAKIKDQDIEPALNYQYEAMRLQENGALAAKPDNYLVNLQDMTKLENINQRSKEGYSKYDVGYGHRVTKGEEKAGGVTIGDQFVPFHSLTHAMARKLSIQDFKTHVNRVLNDIPSLKDKEDFDSQNLKVLWGKAYYNNNTLTKNKGAKALLRKNPALLQNAYIKTLDYWKSNGKRTRGLFNNRINSWNAYAEKNIEQPKIIMYDWTDDGPVSAYFERKPTVGFSKDFPTEKVTIGGQDYWKYNVVKGTGSSNKRTVHIEDNWFN